MTHPPAPPKTDPWGYKYLIAQLHLMNKSCSKFEQNRSNGHGEMARTKKWRKNSEQNKSNKSPTSGGRLNEGMNDNGIQLTMLYKCIYG